MSTPPAHLILVEKGIDSADWIAISTTHRAAGACVHVVTEVPTQVPPKIVLRLANAGIVIRAVDDYVPFGEARDKELSAEALRLTHAWTADPGITPWIELLHYTAFSPWHIADNAIIHRHMHTALKKVTALNHVLHSQQWARVCSIERHGSFWRVFDIVRPAGLFEGLVERITSPPDTADPAPLVAPDHRESLFQNMFDWWAHQVYGDRQQLARNHAFTLRILHQHLAAYQQASTHHPAGQRVLASRSGGLRWRNPGQRAGADAPHGPYLFVIPNSHVYTATFLTVVQQARQTHPVLVLGCEKPPPAATLHGYGLGDMPIEPEPWLYALPPGGVAWVRMWVQVYGYTMRIQLIWPAFEAIAAQTAPTYEGISLWPILRVPLRSMVRTIFPRIACALEALGHICQTHRPRAVCGADRQLQGRMLIEVARHYGIPSLTIQPALVPDTPDWGHFHADKVAVVDEWSKQQFLAHGRVSATQFAVTGLPRWDTIAHTRARVMREAPAFRAMIYQRLGLPTAAQLVVIATQPYNTAYMQRLIAVVREALREIPDTHLIVKLHPRETLTAYQPLAESAGETPPVPVFVQTVDLHELLVAADLVITYYSNTALEAALLDRPVLTINLSGEPDKMPFVAQGIARGAYSEAEAHRDIHRLLLDPATGEQLRTSRHAYLVANQHMLDGGATERVLEVLAQLAVR